MKRFTLGMLALTLFFACRSSAQLPESQKESDLAPAGWSEEQVSRIAPRIAIGKIESRILPGTVIVQQLDEFGQASGRSLRAGEGIPAAVQEKLFAMLANEFHEYGHSLIPPAKNFGQESSWNPELVLNLYWVFLHQNLYGASAGNRADSRIAVEWEVEERSSGQVLHRATTVGESPRQGDIETAQLFSFQMALRRFLEQPSTQRALQRRVSSEASAKIHELLILKLPAQRFDPSESKANTLDRASKAVFSIPSPNGHGCGFWISPEGYAMTAAHVVEGRDRWDALLPDGRKISVEVLRTAPEMDLALLRAQGESFPFLSAGDSRSLKLGEDLFSIGTPVYLSLSQTVTRGIVSAWRKEGGHSMIQTDLAINPGSSGGPILDPHGKVVGVVQKKISAPDVQGVGFGIPIHEALEGLGIRLQEMGENTVPR